MFQRATPRLREWASPSPVVIDHHRANAAERSEPWTTWARATAWSAWAFSAASWGARRTMYAKSSRGLWTVIAH